MVVFIQVPEIFLLLADTGDGLHQAVWEEVGERPEDSVYFGIDHGEIVYGESLTGAEAQKARELVKSCTYDFSMVDAEVNRILWTFTNLFPHCLMKSIAGVRQKKKYFWDLNKNDHLFWLGVNMSSEAFLGFTAFNTKKITGKDTIDFIKYRNMTAQGHLVDDELFEAVLGKPLPK